MSKILKEARKQEFIRGVYSEIEGCNWNENGYPENRWFVSDEAELGRVLGRVFMNNES